ncbi:MAG: lysylphosphatidylglycerol synthase transmembrane domain-containing protein [Flavobacteriales bacterium]
MKKALTILLPLAIGFLMIWYNFKDTTPEQIANIKSAVLNADYFWLLLSIIMGIFSHVSRAIRWKYTLKAVDANYSFLNSLFSVFISYLVNLAIPRAGEISRVAVFSRYENNPFDKTLSTVVAERVVDFIILLIILGSVFLIQFETITEAITTAQAQQTAQDGGTNYWTYIILLLVVLAGIFVVRNKKFKTKIKDFLVGLFDGLKSIWKMDGKTQFLGHTLIIWILYLAMFWVSIYCLPQTSHLGFGAILTAFAAGGIGMVISNGGFGTFPFLISLTLLNYGVESDYGTAFGWIMWISQTLMIVVCGTLSYILINALNKNKDEAKDI